MKKSGYSLVEILIAQFILVIVVSLMYWTWHTITTTTFSTLDQSGNLQGLVTAIQLSVDQIRETRDGEDGGYPLVSALDQELIIFSDIDNDGTPERVRYFLDNGMFKRGTVNASGDPPTYVLADETIRLLGSGVTNDVNEPIFTYYDAAYPDVTSLPLAVGTRLLNTRYIKIFLRVGQSTNDLTRPQELTAGTQLRNLKDDY